MDEKIREQKELIAQKKARLDKKEKLLQERERKLRTKKLIELGSLLEKTKLDQLPGVALFGALLEIKEKSKDPKILEDWHKKGKESVKQSSTQHDLPVAVSFSHSPPEAILQVLRDRSFRWNRFRKEWYGYGTIKDLEEALQGSAPKIEVLS